MTYKSCLTEDFINDTGEICDYMNTVLKSKNASKILKNQIAEKTHFIELTPKMYPIIEKFDRVRRRYRRAIINNYILLYTIDIDCTIYISHLYYNRRNYLNELL